MNNFGLAIDPVFSIWTIILIVLPAFLFFIWKEIRRGQRFLFLRIIAQLIILFSILGLLLRPSYRQLNPSSESIVLTNGYNKAKADSILKLHPQLKIYQTSDAIAFPSAEGLNSQLLSGIGNDVRFILGEGLSHDQLDLIEKKNFAFIAGEAPLGVTQLFVKNPIHINEINTIGGTLTINEPVSLKLTGLGTADSISLKGKGLISFAFPIKPNQTGLFTLSLTAPGVNEVIPIEVLPEQKLKILVLQKFPTAEIRYLKNYLAEKGHSLALRYQTSKNNFKYEYANMPSVRIEKITREFAESFDLIFIDGPVLSEMNQSEKSVLEDAIHNGLGMIILEIPEKSKVISQFLTLETKPVKYDTVHLSLSDSRIHVLPAQAIELSANPSIQAITTHSNRILSGYQYNGAGKVAFQLLQETYKIKLEGNTDAYAAIWSPLIERASRHKNEKFRINLKNPFPFYADESIDVQIISSGPKPSITADGNSLPMSEDVLIDDLWQAKSWAGPSGWHEFSIKEDSTKLNYFVSGKEGWKTLRFTNQVKENLLAQKSDVNDINNTPTYSAVEIAPIMFYLLFLIASGFLWLAPKI